MFQNSKIEQEINSKKENESQISLEKLIKLDCRDSNFLFRDQPRKQDFFKLNCRGSSYLFSRYFRVHYPHTSTDVSPGEHLLKRFWTHVESHYFKKLEKEQLYRFDYLKFLFSAQSQSQAFQLYDKQFQDLLLSVFNTETLQSFKGKDKIQLDKVNHLNRLYLMWKKSQIKLGPKQSKIIQKKLSESLNILENVKNKKKFIKSLQEEQAILNQLLSSDMINGKKQTQNQIQNKIQQLQNELNILNKKNRKRLTKIQQCLVSQQNSQQKAQKPQSTNYFTKSKRFSSKARRSQLETMSQQVHITLQLQQIQFIIKNLQQRQLAQSMSKILECKKINHEYFYLVAFQHAVYVEPKLFSEKEIIRLNKLRETSLFQFYRTGVKSIYSYTCQSYAGFAEVAHNRQALGRYKPKDVFDLMKRITNLTPEILMHFNKFSTCHHCKFLYPEYLLKTCKFSSDRQGLPKNNYEATLDPDFSQVLHILGQPDSKSRLSQRFTTRKKNCLTGYAKINDQYVCGRKYCFSCLKDCYPNDTMNESIFCPFCQGNCSCSRCLRNEKIIKFRSAFTILGGDFLALSMQSCLQKLQNKQQNILPKRRGRPKKASRKLLHLTHRIEKKIRKVGKGELKLDGLISQNKRINLSNKKDKANKRRLIFKQKCLTLSHPKRRRGRPPKNNTQSIKKSVKLYKNQIDQKQIENLFISMSK